MQIVIDPKVNQPALEADVLNLWNERKVFERLVEQTKGGKTWTMVDGPVTANNRLGVHHGWGRTYKDIFQRFNAMRGYRCKWQNGFDCQGLWVEVEVEKDRGLKGPRDIEDFGVGNFTAACRKRVDTFTEEIIEQSKLLGQWADWDNSYRTDSANNILHIWHFLKQCSDDGLLYEGNKVMPWCTRCGTSLSHHEMADSYKDRTDPAINFLCPLKDGKFKGQFFMAWTTTPWTVPANTALAIHPDMMYCMIGTSSGLVWMSQECKNRGMAEIPTLDVQPGSAFLGVEYTPPYKLKYGVSYKVVPWTAIDKDKGSGIVHIAPAFGADDYDLWRNLSHLPREDERPHQFLNFVPVDENGVYTHDGEELLMFKGQNWQKVNKLVVGDLKRRQLLVSEEPTVHRYPHCWRCKEPVIFRQSSQWFLAVTKIRDKLIAAAKTVEWKPDYILQHMVNWLENMGDWCISRRRYWGLPLPFYRCEDRMKCGQVTVYGSIDALARDSGVPEADLRHRLHRPDIDAIAVKCLCGKPAIRVKEVGDCWLDAGIVPFSTFDYKPGVGFGPEFPYDFAVEMREQVRLWFYSTLVMSVVLEGMAPFKTVMTYDEMRDKDGEKFSKTKGNAPSLDKLIREQGADVLRFALASAPTGQMFQFSDEHLKNGKRTFNTLWNTFAYFAQYANADQPENIAGAYDLDDPLDKWLFSRRAQFVADMSYGLRNHDTQIPVAKFADFVTDISTWYVRLKRPVFAGEMSPAKLNAFRVLYQTLKTVVVAMAPLFPFTAEALYQKFVLTVEPTEPDSVHLQDFPDAPQHHFDRDLQKQMWTVRNITQAGHALRNAAKVKVRQPLQTLYVEDWKNPLGWQKGLVCQEVNVLNVDHQSAIPNGWDREECDGMSVGLDVRLNDLLLEVGGVREVIRAVQNRRKELGLVITDHIAIFGVAETPIWTVLEKHQKEILAKTNASRIVRFKAFENGEVEFEVNIMGGVAKFLVVKVKMLEVVQSSPADY